jgi:hypothetical protein
MILYSVIPAEVVFNENSSKNEIQYFEMEYLNERVQVARMNDQFVITRILSTSLKAYLNPGLQPGSIIRETKN